MTFHTKCLPLNIQRLIENQSLSPFQVITVGKALWDATNASADGLTYFCTLLQQKNGYTYNISLKLWNNHLAPNSPAPDLRFFRRFECHVCGAEKYVGRCENCSHVISSIVALVQ
jgi:hypothetical protein